MSFCARRGRRRCANGARGGPARGDAQGQGGAGTPAGGDPASDAGGWHPVRRRQGGRGGIAEGDINGFRTPVTGQSGAGSRRRDDGSGRPQNAERCRKAYRAPTRLADRSLSDTMRWRPLRRPRTEERHRRQDRARNVMGRSGKTSDPSPVAPCWALHATPEGDCGRDEKTASQPNQKTSTMTTILREPRSNGIDTGRPVTEEHFRPDCAGRNCSMITHRCLCACT